MTDSHEAYSQKGGGHPNARACHERPRAFLEAQISLGQLGRYRSRPGAIAPIDHPHDLISFILGETL